MIDIISKELLGLVFGEKIENFIETINDGFIAFYTADEYYKDFGESEISVLNKDTLGRLCKEWCHKQGAIEIHSGIENNDDYVCIVDFEGCFDVLYFRQNNTELQAIIKATEWIAKEKGLL